MQLHFLTAPIERHPVFSVTRNKHTVIFSDQEATEDFIYHESLYFALTIPNTTVNDRKSHIVLPKIMLLFQTLNY